MPEIVPSLPAQSFQELKTKVGLVHDVVSRFQIDVADGMFVTNRSWPMNPGDAEHFQRLVRGVEHLPYSDTLEYEVHFMAHNPEKLLPDWIRVGVRRALFHIEAKHNIDTLLALTQKDAIELGISLKVGTSLSRLDAYIGDITWVQVMGIATLGTQGEPFAEESLALIRALRARYPSVTIQVDGSVDAETAPRLVEAGADILAPGSFVLSSEHPHEAVHTLRHV